jgi:hypothetical protein
VSISVYGPKGKPAPTGSVTLTGGGFASPVTVLTRGVASFTIPAGTLAAGEDVFTAAYTPDSASSSIYNPASGTATVSVKIYSTITWPTLAPINYGTPLGAAQLNASSTIPGTIAYYLWKPQVIGAPPAPGMVLPAGSYSLSATFTPTDTTDYTTTTENQTLTVNPAPLIVTPSDATRVYGTANPVFTATVTGLVNGDPPSLVKGTPALTTTATTTSKVASYPSPPRKGHFQQQTIMHSPSIRASLRLPRQLLS